jgi:hypothetical protein
MRMMASVRLEGPMRQGLVLGLLIHEGARMFPRPWADAVIDCRLLCAQGSLNLVRSHFILP